MHDKQTLSGVTELELDAQHCSCFGTSVEICHPSDPHMQSAGSTIHCLCCHDLRLVKLSLVSLQLYGL
jgi:hypothetical protein